MGQVRLAFIGKSRTGNTFCSRHLYWHHGFKFVGMDDELEAFLRVLYGWPSKRKKYMPWETRLAFYDAWQKVDPTIWAKRAVTLANQKENDVVVPDCRYLAEAKILEEAGFIFIRVHRRPKQIKALKTANTGAIAYYEWFAHDADAYITAKYSINHIDNESTRKAVDVIVKELTGRDKIQ